VGENCDKIFSRKGERGGVIEKRNNEIESQEVYL